MTVATHTTLELAGSRVVVVKRRLYLGPQSASAAAPDVPLSVTADASGATADLAHQRTEAEARWLAAAAHHQGVVRLRLVSVARCRIETHHAGTATLRTATLPARQPAQAQPAQARRSRTCVRPLGATAAAAVLATVAADVAELHRNGLVHGNLSPDHIILPAGRSLGRVVGGVITGAARPLLSSPSGTADDPADDIAGLADLVTALATVWDHPGRTSARPTPTCRAWREAAAQLRQDRHRISARQASRMLSELSALGHRRWTTATAATKAVRRVRSW